MTPSRWVALLGALVLAPLAVCSWRLASAPPFTPGLPEGTPMQLDMEGLVTELSCGSGTLTLRAERAMAGHEDVASFRLGPSTFIDLRTVEATYREGERTLWRVHGPEAQLTADALEFTQPSTYVPCDAPSRPVRRLELRLTSGEISLD